MVTVCPPPQDVSCASPAFFSPFCALFPLSVNTFHVPPARINPTSYGRTVSPFFFLQAFSFGCFSWGFLNPDDAPPPFFSLINAFFVPTLTADAHAPTFPFPPNAGLSREEMEDFSSPRILRIYSNFRMAFIPYVVMSRKDPGGAVSSSLILSKNRPPRSVQRKHAPPSMTKLDSFFSYPSISFYQPNSHSGRQHNHPPQGQNYKGGDPLSSSAPPCRLDSNPHFSILPAKHALLRFSQGSLRLALWCVQVRRHLPPP